MSRPRIHRERVESAGPQMPWLVMIHGFSQDLRLFSAQRADFSSSHRLLLVDLRGHGRSDLPVEPCGVVEYTEDLRAVLDQEGVDVATLWGSHTGAAVGLLFAMQSPNRARGLVLEGPVAPPLPMPVVAARIAQARERAATSGAPAAVAGWFAEAEFFANIHLHPDACREDEHAAMVCSFPGAQFLLEGTPKAVPDLADGCREIRCPALIVNGDHDLDEFLAVASHLQAVMPHAERFTVAGAGGFPGWERPEVVNPRVRSFLSVSGL